MPTLCSTLISPPHVPVPLPGSIQQSARHGFPGEEGDGCPMYIPAFIAVSGWPAGEHRHRPGRRNARTASQLRRDGRALLVVAAIGQPDHRLRVINVPLDTGRGQYARPLLGTLANLFPWLA